MGPLHQWDIETFRAINGLRSPVLDGLFWLVTSTGLGHVQFPLLLALGYRPHRGSPSPREGEVAPRSGDGGGVNSSPCVQGEVAAERSEDDGGGLEPKGEVPPSPSFHSGTPPCKQGGELGNMSPSPGSQEKVSSMSETDEVDSRKQADPLTPTLPPLGGEGANPHPVPSGHRPLSARQGDVRPTSSPYGVGGGVERSETEGVSPSPREGEVAPQSGGGGGNSGLPPSPTASGLPLLGGQDLSPASRPLCSPHNPGPSQPTSSARVPPPGGGGEQTATLWSRFHPAARQALIAGVVAGIIRLPLMRLAGRPRPSNLNFAQPMESVFGNSSFPSGHTTTSFAIAVAVLLALPAEKKKWGWGLLLWALAVAFSRVYCGVHYPTDVLGGALLGSSVAALVNLIRPLRGRD